MLDVMDWDEFTADDSLGTAHLKIAHIPLSSKPFKFDINQEGNRTRP
jgi:hypothetical protein